MNPAPHAAPFNQRIRVVALRVVALLLVLPVALFTRPAAGFHSPVFEVLETVGIYAVVAAILGRFWAILYIGGRKNQGVVQEGPYSVCRHPLYLFSTIGMVGLGLMLGSVTLAVLFGVVTGLALSATARREEAWLSRELGPAWAAYAARVPRVLPRLSGFRTPARIEVSIASLRTNFADALGFLALIPVSELLEELKSVGGWPTLPLW